MTDIIRSRQILKALEIEKKLAFPNKQGKVHVSTSASRYQHKLRMNVINHLGGKCVKCGFSDTRALQVDHVKGGGVRQIRHIPWSKRYKQIIESVPNGEFQLLCANCNWIKRSELNENRMSSIYYR